ncbi:S41 family peptidase [Zemynaea arenosa]|nr:S41 family peptidase [Massilia arenosa]
MHKQRIAAVVGLAVILLAGAAQAGEREARAAYSSKDYARAATLYVEAFIQEPDANLLYNAACSYALAGDRDMAIGTLQRALDAGYVNGSSAEKDSDFASVRGDPRFGQVIAAMKDKQAFENRLFESPALATPWRENISEDEKVAGLSKFWSEVKYNFIYTDTLRQIDWDQLYLEYLPKVRATRSTTEYYQVLMQLCAKLRDGHTNVYPPDQTDDTLLARPLLRTQLAEDRVFVRYVFSPELEKAGVVPGVEIVAVDGEPAAQYRVREVAPYASASTPQDLAVRTGIYGFLSGDLKRTPRVTFARADGSRFTIPVPRASVADWVKARPPMKPFELRMLPGNVAYVALNGFGNQAAADGYIAAWPQIAKASALIIDVRDNGGGNSDVGYRVLATLADKPLTLSQWSTREYKPTYRAWGRQNVDYKGPVATWQPDLAHQFRGKVAVLTAPTTYSAAEDFTLVFDLMKRGAIIGEATGGSTGQPLFFALPGGGRARVCTKKDTYPDGKPFVGVGVQPHIAARQTVADLHKGRDTVLETALAWVTQP